MKPHEMMWAYLRLSPEERHRFDIFYARRVWLLRIWSKLRRATPEQIRRVREILEKKPGWRGVPFAPRSTLRGSEASRRGPAVR
jgi:hypothetical protein